MKKPPNNQTQNIKEIAKIKQSLKMKRHSVVRREKKYIASVILNTRYTIQIHHHPDRFCWGEGTAERTDECEKWQDIFLCFFTGSLRLWVTLGASALAFQFRSGVCLSTKNLQGFPTCSYHRLPQSPKTALDKTKPRDAVQEYVYCGLTVKRNSVRRADFISSQT